MDTLQDKNIAVIVGGPSTEAEVSRRTGAAIAGALQEKGYHAELLELVPDKLASQLQDKNIDIVFNAAAFKFLFRRLTEQGGDGVLYYTDAGIDDKSGYDKAEPPIHGNRRKL